METEKFISELPISPNVERDSLAYANNQLLIIHDPILSQIKYLKVIYERYHQLLNDVSDYRGNTDIEEHLIMAISELETVHKQIDGELLNMNWLLKEIKENVFKNDD